MDDLGWLRLQLEWGADEALAEQPIDRRHAPVPVLPPPARLSPAPPPQALPIAGGALARAQALAASAHTPAALRDALSGFDGCALRTTATSLVFSEGDPAARLVLIADVPGPAEDRSGHPFAGPAAQFLDRMFASAGLDRSATLAMSLLPWRPPGDRKPADSEIQLCLPFLLRHLQLVAPRRVVVFGAVAARTLFAGEARRLRTGWQSLSVPGLNEAFPTLVCSSVLHIQSTPAAKRDAWANLVRLRRTLDADHE
jgi:uracil-DNA glycosylase family 4